MKLKTTENIYAQENCTLRVSSDLSSIEAFSYKWWRFVWRDSAGNVVFNDTAYSASTSKHQWQVKSILRRLGVPVTVTLYNVYRPAADRDWETKRHHL